MVEKSLPPFAGKSILLAEDDIDNQELMFSMLEIMKCHLDIANNGLEAIEKWKKNKYDLIIMDIQMPMMDGFQTASEMRKLEGKKDHTLILGLTASCFADDREKCFEAGMDGYLSKPITFDLLEKSILDLFLRTND